MHYYGVTHHTANSKHFLRIFVRFRTRFLFQRLENPCKCSETSENLWESLEFFQIQQFLILNLPDKFFSNLQEIHRQEMFLFLARRKNSEIKDTPYTTFFYHAHKGEESRMGKSTLCSLYAYCLLIGTARRPDILNFPRKKNSQLRALRRYLYLYTKTFPPKRAQSSCTYKLLLNRESKKRKKRYRTRGTGKIYARTRTSDEKISAGSSLICPQRQRKTLNLPRLLYTLLLLAFRATNFGNML